MKDGWSEVAWVSSLERMKERRTAEEHIESAQRVHSAIDYSRAVLEGLNNRRIVAADPEALNSNDQRLRLVVAVESRGLAKQSKALSIHYE